MKSLQDLLRLFFRRQVLNQGEFANVDMNGSQRTLTFGTELPNAASAEKLLPPELTLAAALDNLLEVMRRADPEYTERHGCRPCTDADWDAAIAAGEETLKRYGHVDRPADYPGAGR